MFYNSALFVHLQNKLTGVGDTPHAHEPLAAHHIPEAPVLSGPHVHHPALVVGLLVHQPVAVHHVAGLAVGHAVTILEVLTVVHHLMHLATEVLLLVDPGPVGSPVLYGDTERQKVRGSLC